MPEKPPVDFRRFDPLDYMPDPEQVVDKSGANLYYTVYARVVNRDKTLTYIECHIGADWDADPEIVRTAIVRTIQAKYASAGLIKLVNERTYDKAIRNGAEKAVVKTGHIIHKT